MVYFSIVKVTLFIFSLRYPTLKGPQGLTLHFCKRRENSQAQDDVEAQRFSLLWAMGFSPFMDLTLHTSLSSDSSQKVRGHQFTLQQSFRNSLRCTIFIHCNIVRNCFVSLKIVSLRTASYFLHIVYEILHTLQGLVYTDKIIQTPRRKAGLPWKVLAVSKW